MMDVIASGCSAYGFGDQRSVEEGTVVTSKGGVKLCLVERRVSMVEGVCFCMMMGFGTLWLFRSA